MLDKAGTVVWEFHFIVLQLKGVAFAVLVDRARIDKDRS